MNEENLFSPNLWERVEATRQYLATGAPNPERPYPEGCRGSLNAFVVLVGPSYGIHHGSDKPFAGGANRPVSDWSKGSIGGKLGKPLFPGGGNARVRRWEKLILACLLGDQDAADSLVAICNLDWGHFGSENDIPVANLTEGAKTILPVIVNMRPRVVVPLSRLVWANLIRALIQGGAKEQANIGIPKHQTIICRFPGATFDTLVVRPLNHPSRHFLTDAKINMFAEGVKHFLSSDNSQS